jgi:hypothetical protein
MQLLLMSRQMNIERRQPTSLSRVSTAQSD